MAKILYLSDKKDLKTANEAVEKIIPKCPKMEGIMGFSCYDIFDQLKEVATSYNDFISDVNRLNNLGRWNFDDFVILLSKPDFLSGRLDICSGAISTYKYLINSPKGALFTKNEIEGIEQCDKISKEIYEEIEEYLNDIARKTDFHKRLEGIPMIPK